ncbi:MAG: Gfo/Idh/MocA family oxidoreductase, partial [Candidatus Aminicenantaceae bacterium]
MIESFGTRNKDTKLKYGMVGGGQGAFIGDVHRKAVAMDGKAELVAGCFSQDYENTLSTGEILGLDKERLYKTYQEMAEAEEKRGDKIDFLIIVTPNNSPLPIAKLALQNGIHVVCDKPLTTDS